MQLLRKYNLIIIIKNLGYYLEKYVINKKNKQ